VVLAPAIVAKVRAVREFAARRVDAIGVALAIAYGLPSLAYPFGRDQAIFFYVGREWAAGRLPYRDAFDVKPPGIYAVYALSGWVFGMRQWSIRLTELLAVLAMGWCAARAVRRDGPSRPGEVGAAILLTAGWHYTCFDYWDTGQAEFWEGLFVLAGYTAAVCSRDWRRAALWSGLLGSIALLFKSPAALLVPVAACVVVARAVREGEASLGARARRTLASVALQAAAAAVPAAIVIVYFAARGGLHALGELAGYTMYYVRHKVTTGAVGRAWAATFWREHVGVWVVLLAALWVAGVVFALRRRDRRQLLSAAIAIGLSLLAVLNVVAQKKFWPYHWGIVTPFLVLSACHGIRELAARAPRWPMAAVTLAIVIGLVFAPKWYVNPNATYRSTTTSFWRYVRGREGRWTYLQQFTGPFSYNYANQEVVGDLIGDSARPGDHLQVHGFEPAIYAVSRLASPSRFASEAPLRDPTLDYHRTTWLAEHDRVLREQPPRFLVTFGDSPRDVGVLAARGYRPVGQFANFVWYRRN